MVSSCLQSSLILGLKTPYENFFNDTKIIPSLLELNIIELRSFLLYFLEKVYVFSSYVSLICYKLLVGKYHIILADVEY